MNREILFKAKPKDWKDNPNKNRWIKGFYCNKQETTHCFKEDYEHFPVKTQHYIIQDCVIDWGLPNEFRFIEIDPDTLCRFTGVYDKNNKKVWENDIVVVDEDVKNAFNVSDGKVEYYGGSFFVGDNLSLLGTLSAIIDTDYVLRGEVVGNVVDNPKSVG